MTCIISPLRKDRDGYPVIKHAKRVMRASHLLWHLLYGKVEPGQMILHTCDNPSCLSPEHLYAGNHRQNMDDKVTRQRVAGDNHPRAKVTEKDVKQMQDLYNLGSFKQEHIADFYGISQSQVSSIIRGKRLGTKILTDDNR